MGGNLFAGEVLPAGKFGLGESLCGGWKAGLGWWALQGKKSFVGGGRAVRKRRRLSVSSPESKVSKWGASSVCWKKCFRRGGLFQKTFSLRGGFGKRLRTRNQGVVCGNFLSLQKTVRATWAPNFLRGLFWGGGGGLREAKGMEEKRV